MQITARFAGKCDLCGQYYRAGETIEWDRAQFQGGRHLTCPTAAVVAMREQVRQVSNVPTAAQSLKGYDDGFRLLGGVDGRTREGRMLGAGRLTVTITNPESQHITLQLCARVRGNDGWEYAPVDLCSYIFVKRDGERVATLYVKDGVASVNKAQTDPNVYRALVVLWQHMYETPLTGYEVVSADFCGKCGQKLTDPESIERGLGPSCFGKATKSRPVGEDLF
jgi:hypothetical protein